MSDVGIQEKGLGHTSDTRSKVTAQAEKFAKKFSGAATPTDINSAARSNAATQILLERARDRASRDKMTGLLNRDGFDRKFANAVTDCKKSNQPLVALFGDLNELTQENEISYVRGDKLITDAADILSEGNKGNVGRWGGDEYGQVFEGKTQDEVLEYVKKDLLPRLAAAEIKMSIGIALVPTNTPEEAHEALRLCQKAMKKSKKIYRQTEGTVIMPQSVGDLDDNEILDTEGEKRDVIGRD